jgi:RNA polymerase sigma-70 factor (ECF subfamily)
MIVLILPDISEDDDLMTRARRGEQDAMMQIYERYFQPIYQFVRLRTGDPALAEDIAGNVFLKLIRAVRTGSAPRSHLRGWLFTVARNEIAQHFGRNRAYPTTTLEEWVPANTDHEPEPSFIQRLDIDRARAALRKLAPDQQEVILLRFGQALSLKETASIMGKSVVAIKSLQARAVKTLQLHLADGSNSRVYQS